MRPDRDPTKWVDDWPLHGLSPGDRKKIKSQLLKAHAAFYRADFLDPYGFIQPMRQAFDGIASILFEANLLTVEILENQLRLFVVEAGVAGGWLDLVPQDEPRIEIFPDYLGHASEWKRFNEGSMHRVFSAEIAEWRSKLLDRSVETAASSASTFEQASPRQLLDSYLRSFHGEKIKIRDLCWATGQHYRELKRWLAGELKDGSTPDLAFRRILTSGKRPLEFNKRQRPKPWE